MTDWRALEAQLDAVVEAQFAERVRIVPLRAGGYAPAVPDPTRSAIEVIRLYETIGDRAMSLMADRAGQPFQTRMALSDMRLSIKTDDLAGFEIREGDHVILLEQGNRVLQVSRAVPDATNMTVITLIRGEK